MHLFFCGTRIKSEGANHQHFFRKKDDYSKTEKENKNRRHGFGENLSDNKLSKFQLNFSRLGVRVRVRVRATVLRTVSPKVWVALGKSFHLCRPKSHKNLKPQPERKTRSRVIYPCVFERHDIDHDLNRNKYASRWRSAHSYGDSSFVRSA